jgi:hypothetical protein
MTEGTAPKKWGIQPGQTTWFSDGLNKKAAMRLVIECDSLADHLDEVLDVKDIIQHKATVHTKDGTESESIRTVLVTKSGKAYAAVSEGVEASIDMLCENFGPPPWTDMKVKAIQKATRQGFKTIRIVPVE